MSQHQQEDLKDLLRGLSSPDNLVRLSAEDTLYASFLCPVSSSRTPSPAFLLRLSSLLILSPSSSSTHDFQVLLSSSLCI